MTINHFVTDCFYWARYRTTTHLSQVKDVETSLLYISDHGEVAGRTRCLLTMVYLMSFAPIEPTPYWPMLILAKTIYGSHSDLDCMQARWPMIFPRQLLWYLTWLVAVKTRGLSSQKTPLLLSYFSQTQRIDRQADYVVEPTAAKLFDTHRKAKGLKRIVLAPKKFGHERSLLLI